MIEEGAWKFLLTEGRVQVQEGQTVLDVARANGFDIPTLCHLAGLTPTGACRICVVEVDGMRNLVAVLFNSGIRWHGRADQ